MGKTHKLPMLSVSMAPLCLKQLSSLLVNCLTLYNASAEVKAELKLRKLDVESKVAGTWEEIDNA